ncbi:hypothetical protein ABZT27_15240 [Streptomyces sp. NPDC005389]|uniref:hypothetical protein n=1 Tax=Streptomyces sp. NPDC005389 TaxID=3157040 RepID=UPI0033B2E390
MELYGKPSEVLFAHQDGQNGVAQALHQAQGTLITRWADLVEAMTSVVVGAKQHLVVAGSRSREKAYLSAIELAVAQNPDLMHTRVLYGPPRHPELAEHLMRLMELRDPAERRNGVRTLSIGLVDRGETLERFFVASESQAVVPLPFLHSADGFDCGIVLGREAARPRPGWSTTGERHARRGGCWARYGTCGMCPCATDREVGVARA